MTPETTNIVIAIAIALLGGSFRGFAGFGGGLLMAPLLTLIYPPDVVVPMLLLIALVGDARLLPEVRKDVKVRRILWVAVPAFIGLPIGIYALKTLDAEVVRRFVSGTVLVLTALLFRGLRFENADRPLVLVPTGIISGALSGIGGVGGPPVVLAYLSLGEPAKITRANLIGYFALTGVVAVAMMLVGGVLEAESATLAALTAVPYFVAIHFGSRAFSKEERDGSYRTIALGFLGVVAVFGLVWPV